MDHLASKFSITLFLLRQHGQGSRSNRTCALTALYGLANLIAPLRWEDGSEEKFAKTFGKLASHCALDFERCGGMGTKSSASQYGIQRRWHRLRSAQGDREKRALAKTGHRSTHGVPFERHADGADALV